MSRKKRRQVRRCSVCGKVGHNRSTCSQINNQINKKEEAVSNSQTLKFFVHHVSSDPSPSEHLIDLKEHNIWNEIESIAPELNSAQPHHFYHHNLPRKPKQKFQPKPKLDSIKKNPVTPIKKTTAPKTTPTPLGFKPKPKIKIPKFSWPKIKIKTRTKKQVAKTVKTKTRSFSNIKNRFKNQRHNFCYHFRNWQQLYFPFKRTVISIAIFSLIIFAPTHAQSYYKNIKITAGKITNNSTDGYSALKDSTELVLSGNVEEAEKSLEKALVNFNKAVDDLNQNHKWLQRIADYVPILNKEIETRQGLVLVGQNITLGNKKLLKTIKTINNNSSSTLADNLKIAADNLPHILPHYQEAKISLQKTDSKILPEEYRQDFEQFKILYSAFVNDLEQISNSAMAIKEIIGGQGLRRYLLVFQNPHELRATGGFMGSFALLEIKDGKIIDLKVPPGGSYDVQGQLSKYVEPPAPMLLSNSRWHFHDSNWFPDFRASAQKMMWFYRHSRDITTDGVIAINATVLNRVLDIVGPVKDEKRDLVLTSNNAIGTIQKIVETGEEKKQNKPKQIISDLAPKFIEDFKKIDPVNILPALSSLQEALTQKEIQLYFNDTKPQITIAKLGWDGKILDTTANQDYLFVVNTNLQGQKSDAMIKQKINHESVIQPDGTIINTVTITKKHTGQKGVKLYGQTNIDYIRLYAPKNSHLISAGGFTWVDDKHFKAPNKYAVKDKDLDRIEKEVGLDPLSGTLTTNEFNKTSFANWVVTQPGQTSQVYFTYRLPFKADNQKQSTQKKWMQLINPERTTSNYQLVVQKQSGTNNEFSSSIIYPNSWQPYWFEGQNVKLASNGAVIKTTELDKDKVWSLIMKKNK